MRIIITGSRGFFGTNQINAFPFDYKMICGRVLNKIRYDE